MIQIKERANISIDYDIEKICREDEILFFDIETTGLSRKYDYVYLIGFMSYVSEDPVITQYFAESRDEEFKILKLFNSILSDFDVTVHYNGDAFDIPFLRERGKLYGIDFAFEQKDSIDLYKRLKPYQTLLNLPNLRQKTVENLFNVKREDKAGGKELTEVYKTFVRTKDENLLRPLLLHNREDVMYMGKIISSLSLCDFMENTPRAESFKFTPKKDNEQKPVQKRPQETEYQEAKPWSECGIAQTQSMQKTGPESGIAQTQSVKKTDSEYEIAQTPSMQENGSESRISQTQSLLYKKEENDKSAQIELQITFKPESDLPFSFTANGNGIRLEVTKSRVTVKAELTEAELKYYFKNYKDYYYLTEEKRAIHKSVASFVDKKYRRPAAESECYVSKKGNFLPLFESYTKNFTIPYFKDETGENNCRAADDGVFGKLFQKEYRDKERFIPAEAITEKNIDIYAAVILDKFKQRKSFEH